MGMMPVSRGMPKSCMGTAARSAISRASTSSEGSSSPTWRLPMRRMPTNDKEVENDGAQKCDDHEKTSRGNVHRSVWPPPGGLCTQGP